MLATALAAVTFPLHAQQAACPAAVTAAVDSAWRLLRADSTARARPMFTRALTACPTLPDARVGLGFLVLRAGELTTADSLFQFADIIAVAGNPLTDVTEMERVRFVMKGGMVIRNTLPPATVAARTP